MTRFPPRLSEDVKKKATLAEAERYFVARARRAMPGRAKAILAKAGTRTKPRPGDRLDAKKR